MMNHFCKRVLLSFAAMLFVVSAAAQVTTSTLNGKVSDSQGEPVVGASVVAVHTPSGSQYYAVANAEGRFYINGMRAGGPYTVEVSCLGYTTVTYTDITLQLAEAYSLDATLSDDAEMLGEAIVISEAATKFATEKTGAATNVKNSQITALPNVTRSLTDVTRLSPYGGNGLTFMGSDDRTSNFTIDGANFNNNFGLSGTLPGGGNPVSLDAIEEMQIVISPFDVRQNNFIGGGVNAITKSGTNTFKGSAYISPQRVPARQHRRRPRTRRPRPGAYHHLRYDPRWPDHQEQALLLRQLRVHPPSGADHPLASVQGRCRQPGPLHFPYLRR